MRRFCLALALLGCARPQPALPIFTIASLLPRTGSSKTETDGVIMGIRLALDEADDMHVTLIDVDTLSPIGWPRSESDLHHAIRDVATDSDIVACIGTWNSAAARVAIPAFESAGLLMISPANSAPDLTRPGSRVYARVVPHDAHQGTAAAAWAKKQGAKRVYVLDDDEEYGSLIAEAFMKRAKQDGLPVLGHGLMDPRRSDHIELAEEIAQAVPDLVFIAGGTPSNVALLLGALAAIPCVFLVPDGCFDEEFLRFIPAAINERCFVTFGAPPPPREFSDAYRAKFGRAPSYYSYPGYQAAKAVLEALRSAGKADREGVRAAGRSLAIFDEHGDVRRKEISLYAVRDGMFVFVEAVGE